MANLTAEQVRRKEGAGDGTVMGNKMENDISEPVVPLLVILLSAMLLLCAI